MHIAFLTWRDTSHPDGGGSEVFVEEVARRLVARGHEVTLVTARTDRPTDETSSGVHVHRTGGRLTVYPRGLLWAAASRRRVDVVVDVVNGLPFWTPLLRRHGVVALQHHVHERQWRIIYPGWRGRLGWFLEGTLTPRVYRRVPHLTVSESTRRDLVALGIPAASIRVARNGLDARPCGVARSDTPRLCVLARLVPHKQIEHALELVRDLRGDVPALHLDVIGEGWWRDRLVAHAQDLGVSDAVTFHGHVPDAERDRLLGRAWLMVLPSVKEGWGLAVLEAAAQGTATVAYSDAGGVTEAVVDGVTGRLVADYPGLLTEVSLLVQDRAACEQLGARARERAARFTWEATTEVVAEALEEAAQRSP